MVLLNRKANLGASRGISENLAQKQRISLVFMQPSSKWFNNHQKQKIIWFLTKVTVLQCKAKGFGHAPDPTDALDELAPVSSAATREPHATRARGQDDGSYTKRPQINKGSY